MIDVCGKASKEECILFWCKQYIFLAFKYSIFSFGILIRGSLLEFLEKKTIDACPIVQSNVTAPKFLMLHFVKAKNSLIIHGICV